MKIHVVLFEPEIPQNTGNIARTCAAIGASLHLIEPLGFSIEDKYLKRAGLDYWDKLEIFTYPNLEAFYQAHEGATIYYYSKKAHHVYTEVTYPEEVFLMFGKETKGIPEDVLRKHEHFSVRIPMRESLRSLNLSNTVAIGVYEALRQHQFEGLQNEGNLKL